jgi:pimeloyl-ACP methyl ester carboxylesterase
MKYIRPMSSIAKPNPLSQTCLLPDGRILSYAEYGDPNGYPLMFFHGYPSCRLEAWFLHPMVQRKRIRLIAPDRPGFGHSTFLANRRFTDYPSDVRALADHMKLDKFAILGGSGGGPYAVACAKDIPDRLSAVGLFASAGPWAVEGDKEMRKELMKDERAMTKFWAGAVRHAPGVTNIVTKAVVGTTRWLFSQKWFVARTDNGIRRANAKDLKQAEEGKDGNRKDWYTVMKSDRQRMDEEGTPGPGEQLALAFRETFHQGTAATMQEAAILFSPWGFDVSTITYNKIQVWHGTKDTNAPLSQIQYVVNKLPHCDLKTYEANHFELVQYIENTLDDLITDTVRQQ